MTPEFIQAFTIRFADVTGLATQRIDALAEAYGYRGGALANATDVSWSIGTDAAGDPYIEAHWSRSGYSCGETEYHSYDIPLHYLSMSDVEFAALVEARRSERLASIEAARRTRAEEIATRERAQLVELMKKYGQPVA